MKINIDINVYILKENFNDNFLKVFSSMKKAIKWANKNYNVDTSLWQITTDEAYHRQNGFVLEVT